MDKHKNKMIAPIVITVLTVVYLFFYCLLIMNSVGGIVGLLLGIVPLAFAAVMVCVCISRYHEIKKGEEDDLSQY